MRKFFNSKTYAIIAPTMESITLTLKKLPNGTKNKLKQLAKKSGVADKSFNEATGPFVRAILLALIEETFAPTTKEPAHE